MYGPSYSIFKYLEMVETLRIYRVSPYSYFFNMYVARYLSITGILP